MKTAKMLIATAVLGAAFLASAGAQAADLKRGGYKDMEPTPVVEEYGPGWMIRFRGLGVVPQEGSGNWKLDHAHSAALDGAGLNITNSVVPELDISYFFTKNIAAELILGVTPHQVNSAGSLSSTLHLGQIGNAWLLPPTLLLQYHFYLDKGIKPYVGVGVNYTIFFNEGTGTGFQDFNLDDNWGWALQAGIDIPLGGNWFFNVDVKKIFLDTKATVGLGAAANPPIVTADVQVDPWLIGVGVGYRFGAAPQPLK
jgi:outer membrane protein